MGLEVTEVQSSLTRLVHVLNTWVGAAAEVEMALAWLLVGVVVKTYVRLESDRPGFHSHISSWGFFRVKSYQ